MDVGGLPYGRLVLWRGWTPRLSLVVSWIGNLGRALMVRVGRLLLLAWNVRLILALVRYTLPLDTTLCTVGNGMLFTYLERKLLVVTLVWERNVVIGRIGGRRALGRYGTTRCG